MTAPPAVVPADLAGARAALLDAAAAGATLECRGAGVSAPWAPGRGSADVVVDTSGLRHRVRHEAGDLTVVVGAGEPLGELQGLLGRAGQFLAFDPPGAASGATVGGALSAGTAGPSRHRYGTLRDLVIGIVVVLADGTVARSGGTVIKNVAGYDLAKLFCGAHGSLGLVASVALRLHPLPHHRATVRVDAGAADATALTVALLASPLVPSALDYATGALAVRFEGTAAGARDQAAAAVALAGTAGLAGSVHEGEEERAAWAAIGAETAGGAADPDTTVLRATTRPADMAAAADALAAAADDAGVAARFASHAGVGVHTARVAGGDAAAHWAVLEAWRGAVGRLGGTVAVRDHPDWLADPERLAGPAPGGLAVMRRIKAAFDPDGRLAPGRFIPWW